MEHSHQHNIADLKGFSSSQAASDGDRELPYYRTSPDNKDFHLQGPQKQKQASRHRGRSSIQMGTWTNIYNLDHNHSQITELETRAALW